MNKVVVITGGSSGIGKATCELFTKNGDIVYILARSVETSGNNYKCDVSCEEDVKFAIEDIAKKHGKIDILVNNAGYGISGALELTSTEQMERIFDVNTKGIFLTCKYAIKYMEKGSSIINISSTCALFPVPFRSLYCASKSATNMLSLGYAMELKESKIKVCTICPGETKSEFTKNRVKNFATNERYGNRIANASYSIDKKDDKRMPAIKVAKVIFKMANKRKPKAMKIVSGKMKFLYFAYKLLPMSIWIKLTNKMFGGYKEFKDNPYLEQ